MSRAGIKAVFIIGQMFKRYTGDEVGKASAAMAYYFIFTFFPLVIFLSMLLGFAGISTESVTAELQGFIPLSVIELIKTYIEHVSSMKNTNVFVVSIAFTLYFPMRTVYTLMHYINKAYRINERRSRFRSAAAVAFFTVFFFFSVFTAIGLMLMGETSVKVLLNAIGQPAAAGWFTGLWNIIRFILQAVLIFILVSALYYTAQGKKAKARYVYPGTLFAMASWLLSSVIFSFYVENMGKYSLFYGSIAAIIVLLIWLNMTSASIILGAELNHILLSCEAEEQI